MYGNVIQLGLSTLPDNQPSGSFHERRWIRVVGTRRKDRGRQRDDNKFVFVFTFIFSN